MSARYIPTRGGEEGGGGGGGDDISCVCVCVYQGEVCKAVSERPYALSGSS